MVSGINHGPNLADDVTYSGTVAAAMEASMLGVPAIAFSLATRRASTSGRPRASRGRWSRRRSAAAAAEMLLNVNIPPGVEPPATW